MLKIKSRMGEVEKIVDAIEDHTIDRGSDMAQFERDMDELDRQKATHHPCERIADLLEKWETQETYTHDDLEKFAVSYFLVYRIEGIVDDSGGI